MERIGRGFALFHQKAQEPDLVCAGMRALRPAFALCLAAASVLAGCATPDGGETVTTGPIVVTDPRDYSYLQNGTSPGAHVHDYWQGRSAVTVLDHASGRFSASCSGCTEAMQVLDARPEEGDIVPQGTAWLNVTVSWTTDDGRNDFGDVRLLLRPADQAEAGDAGVVQNGVTRTLNTTNPQNDPPHYVLSLWRFGVAVAPKAGDDVAFSGTMQIRVEAVRGLPLVAYPPHPDRWQGLTELPLAHEERTVDLQYQEELQGGTSTTCYGGCLGHIGPIDGAVVPVEATQVVVTLEFEAGAIPAGVGLLYHGADTWAMAEAAGESSVPPGTVTFRIPVTGLMPDSPYAPQSLWEFRLYLDQPTPVRAWEGTYTFTAASVK